MKNDLKTLCHDFEIMNKTVCIHVFLLKARLINLPRENLVQSYPVWSMVIVEQLLF